MEVSCCFKKNGKNYILTNLEKIICYIYLIINMI